MIEYRCRRGGGGWPPRASFGEHMQMALSFAPGPLQLLMCFPCRSGTSTRVQPRLNPQMWRVLSMYCHVLPRILVWGFTSTNHEVFYTRLKCTLSRFLRDAWSCACGRGGLVLSKWRILLGFLFLRERRKGTMRSRNARLFSANV